MISVMKKELIELLAEVAELDEEEISEEVSLEELGIDSLMFIDFCVRVEKKWKIKLDPNKLVEIDKVKNLISFIEENISN